jgi:hypothetical protein
MPGKNPKDRVSKSTRNNPTRAAAREEIRAQAEKGGSSLLAWILVASLAVASVIGFTLYGLQVTQVPPAVGVQTQYINSTTYVNVTPPMTTLTFTVNQSFPMIGDPDWTK